MFARRAQYRRLGTLVLTQDAPPDVTFGNAGTYLKRATGRDRFYEDIGQPGQDEPASG